MKGGKILSKKKNACIVKPALKCKNSKKLIDYYIFCVVH